MQRAASFVRFRNFRGITYTLGGASSVVVGYRIWLDRKPLLLDSAQNTSSWQRESETAPANKALSERFRQAANEQAEEQEDETSDQPPPPQTKGHSVFDFEGDAADAAKSAWSTATGHMDRLSSSFAGKILPSWGDKLSNLLVPSWIKVLPGLLQKLQNEMSMAPWSLSWEIWEEAHDPQINPEVIWDAQVRISGELCKSEQEFLQKRKLQTAKALARYLDLAEQDVHPDDVPTIAVCGSGGGLRALVAGTSSYLSAHESGLFDCVTYTAGVSGSCWLQSLYYSSIGHVSHQQLIDHLKARIGVHIAYPPAALTLLNQAPTNKFLLSGFVEKLRGVPDADFGLVDVYGLLLAARLMVPKGELTVDDYDMKVSNQRYYLEDGMQPLPIYTAVRHEIPAKSEHIEKTAKEARFTAKHYDWFQWFEWTPYEFFCEELNAGIPTWAMGRKFNAGNTVWRENGMALPELRVPLMMGIWGSAFCATLSHYYKEIRPIIKAAGWAQIDSMLSQKDEDLVKVHPVDPAVIPNFALGLRSSLPESTPESIHTSSHLQLMDAGMSNNLPIYPLLRPGRDIDIIVAFDASADVKTDNWVKVVDGYVRQRGIKGWPMGAGWPPAEESSHEISQEMELAEAAAAIHPEVALDPTQEKRMPISVSDLGPCTVWVGAKQTSDDEGEYMDDPPTKRLAPDASDADSHIRDPNSGIALVYFPFLKNDSVPGVDPLHSEFMSTWNFVYTPEEIEKVVDLARANFEAGKAQTKRVVRAVWERKREMRLKREKEEEEYRGKTTVKFATAHRWQSGDQFSARY